MKSFFIITLSDVVGLVLLGAIVLGAAIFACVAAARRLARRIQRRKP